MGRGPSPRLPARTVLHVIPSLVGGGAEHQLILLARLLVEQGIRVHVAFTHGGVRLDALRATGAILHHLGGGNNSDPRLLRRLMRVIDVVRPDLMQTWLLQADIIGGLCARIRGIPWILSERCGPPMYGQGWKNHLRSLLGQRSDAVVANSRQGCVYWRDKGHGGPFFVVRNIIPLRTDGGGGGGDGSVDRLVREQVGEAPILVGAGRLEEQKDWETAIRAFAAIAPQHPSARLVVFGEGALRERLQSLSAGLAGSDRILLPGFTANLPAWLRRASALVSTSRFEGNPNVVLEAMALGTPVILTDIPAHRECMPEEGAWFVPVGSDAAAGAAMASVLEDPHGARVRAVAAARALDSHHPGRVVEDWRRIYDAIICRSGHKP